jgi:hypothetical protein
MNSSFANSQTSDWKPAQSWLVFILITLVFLLTAHAIAFFPHEYAHSTVAWMLGWKSNPLALNYGHLNAGNLLAQFDIDENVDYDPIFSSGNGVQAGLIAAAGVVIGNGISYGISRWGYNTAKRQNSLTWCLFFFWLCLASVGNFIDYVPVRVFAPHGDMFTLAKGFNCSPWWILIVMGIPFGAAIVDFFCRFAPRALCWLFPESPGKRLAMILLTTLIFFGFYGNAGLSGYGEVSHDISLACVCLIPFAALLEWWQVNRLQLISIK